MAAVCRGLYLAARDQDIWRLACAKVQQPTFLNRSFSIKLHLGLVRCGERTLHIQPRYAGDRHFLQGKLKHAFWSQPKNYQSCLSQAKSPLLRLLPEQNLLHQVVGIFSGPFIIFKRNSLKTKIQGGWAKFPGPGKLQSLACCRVSSLH